MGVQRNMGIDYSKGFAVFLMVVGHLIPSESMLYYWIYSFHMPLFFVLSGYCFTIDGKSIKLTLVSLKKC